MNNNVNIKNIYAPELPESVNDASVLLWHKKIGDSIKKNEAIVDIETDKIMLEVTSFENGILNNIFEEKGKIVKSKQILGTMILNSSHELEELNNKNLKIEKNNFIHKHEDSFNLLTPSNRRLAKIKSASFLKIKKDSVTKLSSKLQQPDNNNDGLKINKKSTYECLDNRKKTITPMSRIRKTISERLLYTTNNTAMLTTFNEVNMSSIIKLRKKYSKKFLEHYGIRLGYMSFYVKSVVESLKKYPEINSAIEQDNIITYHYYDINIAISTSKGLVTPVLYNVDTMSMHEIEKSIKMYAMKGESGTLNLKDLTGGTFTISNGGVFGSLMSTPIINPPQAAILGIHLIKNRPVAINDSLKICPMVYLALSYDHRLIDGKSAISFLNSIKNFLEDYSRITLEI